MDSWIGLQVKTCLHILVPLHKYLWLVLKMGFRVISNVITVKEQTFHKRSTNIPTSNRNETKMSESLFPNLPHRKSTFLFIVQETRFWTKSKQSVLNKTNSKTIPKRFGFIAKILTSLCLPPRWHRTQTGRTASVTK